MTKIDKINGFLQSKAIIYALALLVTVIWLSGQEIIGCILFVMLAVFFCCFRKGLGAYLALLTMCAFSISLTQFDTSFSYDPLYANEGVVGLFVFAAIAIVAIVGAFVAHLIVFKPVKPKQKSSMLLPSLAVLIAIILAGLTSQTNAYQGNIFTLALYAILMYLFWVSSYVQIEDLKGYVSHVALASALAVAIEVIAFYLRQDDMIAAILSKKVVIGWGMSNSIAPCIALGLFPTCYLFTRKNNFIYILPIIIMLIGLVFTMCRTILLQVGLWMLVAAVMLIILSPNKRKAIIAVAIMVGLCATMALIFKEQIADIIQRLLRTGVEDSARESIRQQFLQMFVDNIIFGGGYATNVGGLIYPALPHSTIVQVIGNNGIIGMIAFGWYYVVKYKTLLRVKMDSYNIFVGIAMIMFVISSFFDHAFYFVFQNTIVIVLLEASNRDMQYNKIVTSKRFVRMYSCNWALVVSMAVALVLGVLSLVIATRTIGSIYIFGSDTVTYMLYSLLAMVSIILFFVSASQLLNNAKDRLNNQRGRVTNAS